MLYSILGYYYYLFPDKNVLVRFGQTDQLHISKHRMKSQRMFTKGFKTRCGEECLSATAQLFEYVCVAVMRGGRGCCWHVLCCPWHCNTLAIVPYCQYLPYFTTSIKQVSVRPSVILTTISSKANLDQPSRQKTQKPLRKMCTLINSRTTGLPCDRLYRLATIQIYKC